MPKKPPEKMTCKKCFAELFCTSLHTQDNDALNALLHQTKASQVFQENEYLFHSHDSFLNFYMVKQGAFKKFLLTADGREQIGAFFLPGELIGLDSVGYQAYQFSVVAIQHDSIACEIPAEKLLPFIQQNTDMQSRLLKITSEQFHHIDFISRNAHAKEKIAAFLLNISERYHACNKQNTDQIRLPMSRQDIGNYLGLTIETVSRIFTELKKDLILEIQGKEVIISDIQKLSKTAGF
ncbi:MAG: helix-turn-helix domain-containing protein [Coxiellaceae bacterium]|nr:helix-turn-helix domain-containing protein [Coxiellaceae bacterium]